jgi:hypothetical protein
MSIRVLRMLQNAILVTMMASVVVSIAQFPLDTAPYCVGLTCNSAEECGSECFCARGTCRSLMDQNEQ